MLSFAEPLAATAGLNVTRIVQEAPAGRLVGQLFACANHGAWVPRTLMPMTENATVPLFATVAFSAALIVPTGTLPELEARWTD